MIRIISDLHLSERSPRVTELLQIFLHDWPAAAHSLFILGDFFNYWIGDDVASDFQVDIANELKLLANRGVNIYFMVGNRDFLLGEQFCELAGMQLIQEPYSFRHNDQNITLLHGDVLCTDDVAYQRYRKVVRSSLVQSLFLSLPKGIRLKIANKARAKSKAAQQKMAPEMSDVNANTVSNFFTNNNADVLIHGHTHRFNTHQHELSGQQKSRLVLGDWTAAGGSFVELSDSGIELKRI